METSLELFNQFRPMIERYVWKAKCKYPQFERDDLQSQAFLIFTEALNKYDPSRNTKFSTFLYNELRRLTDYCKSENKKRSCKNFTIINVSNNDDYLKGFDYLFIKIPHKFYNAFEDKRENLDTAFEDLPLSNDAKDILALLFSYEWYIPGCNKNPNIQSIKRDLKYRLNWDWKRIEITINTIQKWWNSKGYLEFTY